MLMGAAGCSDDLDTGFGVNEVEGRDTKISLSVSAPEMPRLESRADMADEDAYKVETLWVGIYNSGSGKSTLLDGTNNGLFLQDGDPDNNHGFSGGVKSHDRYALEDINTKSGRSYIVAVANPDKNTGYKMDAQGNIGAETSLLTLLQGASTWEEFKSIVISRPLRENGAADIFMPNATINPLVMSGIYSEVDMNHAANYDWSQVEPVYIGLDAGGVTLPGAIHLRRPYSQIKFDIQRAENTDIVDFEVESYVVHNVPTYGWLFERKQSENPAGKPWEYANAGDPMELDVTKNTNYRSSLTYTSADIEGSNNHFTFDFWQMENKRTGILEGADITYQKRDVEFKTDGGQNTGVYTSLCPKATPQVATLNNFAGYVEINAKLTYKNAVSPDNPEAIPGIPDEEFDYTSREVNAKYIIHLGYIGANANDFNSLRNSIYTYRVKIKSASEIIVEAFTNNENQPGAEGTVIDVTKQMFNLDAHYAAFNIELTREDLNSFSFSILADNYRFAIGEDGKPTANSNDIPTSTTDDTYPYYSWIELAKTTGEDVLAAYPGIGTYTGSNRLYRLKDIRDNAATLTPGWYTVFVNEYTYEDESEDNRGNEKTNWRNYVNKPNRMAYLNVAQHVSADGLSSYYRSKYAVSQRSIQTYYNAAEATTALGVEHDNETFGMNIRWLTGNATNINGKNYPGVSLTGLSNDNGRYNVWINSGGSDKDIKAGKWETYVQTTKPNAVDVITNTNQNLPPALKPAKTWPVPMPMLLAPGNFTQAASYVSTGTQPFPNVYNRQAGAYDPQINHTSAQYIQAMHACMNRNRDLNGDGDIDANELRWYLPAAGKYVRVILGRNSLSTPIMDYESTQTLPFGSGRGQNSRFHMIASDNVIIWCEEGLSRSMMNTQNYSGPPWAVRCIRNLGTNLRNVTSDEKVDPAYDGSDLGTDNYSTGGVVKVKHYYGTSLRDNSGEALPMHKSNSAYNKLGRYGFEIALRGNQTTQQNTEASATGYRGSTTAYTNAVNAASPCATLNAPLPNGSGRTGWRVPNQKEIVIMRRLGLVSGTYYMTCTQEYWNNTTDASGGNTFNRILTVRPDAACAADYDEISVVRCVRDLTAAEAGKTYYQIRNNQ